MAIHTDLPIYRTGVQLMSLAVDAQMHMPRGIKRSMGDKIADHCVEMLNLMALANATKAIERAAYIRQLLARQRAVQVLLRVCFDRRDISLGLWSKATQLLDSIGKQANGWIKKTTNTGPAA
jgi:hypothetical protein